MIKASVYIICKNEEKHIKRVLESIKDFNEIIIVDSGSNDNTLEIAKNYTKNIYHQDWIGFAKQKEYARSLCSNEWVLNLDADEELTNELKNEIIKFLESENHEVKDFGTYSTDSCDYPDIALPVAEAVAAKEYELGILICGTGIGIGIAANKVPGIRAALCSDTFSAHATREHNNANILTMGQRVVGTGLALDIVKTFISSKFEGDRHQKRIDKIAEIENKYSK